MFEHVFEKLRIPALGDPSLTGQDFLGALASTDPDSFPAEDPDSMSNGTPTTPTTTTKKRDRAVAFKSPSESSETTTTVTHLDSPLQTPQRRTLRSSSLNHSTNDPTQISTPPFSLPPPAGIASFSSPSILPVSSPTALAPSPTIHPATPSPRRITRLHAFSAQAPSRTSSLVPAEVKGLGRVALDRDVLFKALGEETAQEAMRKAREKEMGRRLAFGNVDAEVGEGLVGIEPFAVGKKKGKKMKSKGKGKGKNLSGFGLGGEEMEMDEEIFLAEAGREKLRPVKKWLEASEVGSEGEDEEDGRGGEGWSTAPDSWHAELDEFAKTHAAARLERELTYSDSGNEENEDEMMEEREEKPVIRVGGKNITMLVRSKRNRLAEDQYQGSVEGEEEEGENEDESITPTTTTPTKFKIQRFPTNKKGKGRADVTTNEIVSCLCGNGDEGEAMVQCDDCRIWFHLDCLEIPSVKQLPREWFCFRCTGVPPPPSRAEPPSPKRTRIAPPPPSTPIVRREPILVETALSPRPKGNFYRNSAPDMVLAPSPQVSPSRRLAPRTPIIPRVVTPPLGSSRADYSPRSPLFSRAPRTRFISGASASEDAAHWDGGAIFSLPSEENLVGAWEEDRLGTWNDLTMTPSRAVAHLGWGELALATPSTSSSRRSRKYSLMGDVTPSQHFLSALNQPLATSGSSLDYHQSGFSSPLGPKSSSRHQRKPSIPAMTRFDINPFPSPRFTGERALPLKVTSERETMQNGEEEELARGGGQFDGVASLTG